MKFIISLAILLFSSSVFAEIVSCKMILKNFIIANNTIDESIHDRLKTKFENMNSALNDSWPQTLDYDGNSVIVSANSANNDLISLVSNLKNTVDSTK